jgi:hypothetical protein
MSDKTQKQMAKMVDAVQPYCDEPIIAAMTCSHAGATQSAIFGGSVSGFGKKPSSLPSPVFLAVGADTVYAFKYAPRGFKFKIKDEVARWPKDSLHLAFEKSKTMANFVLTTASGESHHLEVTILMGAEALVDMFFKAITDSQA